MCTVSMVGDYWRETTFPTKYQTIDPLQPIQPQVSREEFEKLKKDFEELKKLLMAAKKYDEEVGEADCEADEKVALIKKLAKELNVDMSDVFS